MDDLRKITLWFQSQVGTMESPPGSNSVIYNTDFYGSPVRGDSFPWCCAFVWDGFAKTGLANLFCAGQKTAYCPFVVQWAKSHNQWIDSDYRAGDLILYDWTGDGVADHIGFCLSFDGRNLKTIEGNVDSAVKELIRPLRGVMGAYRPAYGTEEETPAEQPQSTQDGTYTVKAGDSVWLIAVTHNMTMERLARLNHMSIYDVIYPGQVLKLREDQEPEPDTDAQSGNVYTVRDGDSLWTIAQALLDNGWRWPKIATANGLTFPYVIHPGDRLIIPRRDGEG